MSIKTTTGIEVSLDTTEVTPTNTKDIVTDNQHCVEIENNESIIEGSKQEYSIVGDGLYASISADEAPQWLVDIVDNVVSTSMLSSFDNYNDLVQEVRSAIDSIDVAANTYVEQINIQSLVDGIIASRLASLNATVEGNTATILDLDTALVNLDESFAQRVTDITASFNDTTDARITEISQARADGDEALAQQITALDASIQDTNSDVSGQASAISGLQIYVGLDGSSDPNGTGVLSRVSILEKQNDGVIEYTTGTYDVMIGVVVDDNTPDNNQLDTSQAPYSTWIAADTAAGTEETRAAHVGDVYIQYSDDGNGNRTYIKSYKFIKTVVDETSPYSTDVDGYTWALVADTDLQATYTIALEAKDLADNKRRVFTTQPTGPYDIGDLWVKAGTTVNEVTTPQTVNVATASRTTGFLESEWELADEQAKDFIENTWEPESATIKNQIDGKIEYFFYESYTDIADATDEANALDIKDDEWNTQALKENAHGNIVYFKDTRNAYWYNSSIPEWLTVDNTDIYEALQDAASAQGAADGKISQFYAWSGTTAPADYTATITEAVYSTDANGNFLDANGDITTIPSEYVEIEAAVTENISGNSVQYWFKADNTLYYRNTASWDAVPTTSGTGDKYISAGDLLTVFNPTDRDTTVYTFNGTSWDTTGPTSVISKSRFFTDLDNEVRGPNGIVATTANGIRLDSEAYTDDTVTTLRNSFAYNSALKIGETYYNTGFGLDASAVTQDPNADGTSASTAYDSEFWINAERFVLKSPSYPGVQAVFTVKASGISLGTEYTEATRNEPKGVYSSSKAYGKGDVVSYNNSSYVAMVDMTAEQNEVPGTNPLKWQLLAAQGVSPVVYEFQGNDTWPTNTNEDGADEHVFDSLFAGNVVVRVLAYDAEGGVNISLNGGTAVPFTRTLGDNTEEWYQFSFDNLVVGSNTLRFWSTTDDGGSIKQIAVSFAGASGLNGGSVDFFFIRSASEPTTLPSEGTDWRTDVTQVAAGAGDLWSIKEITPLGGGTPTYEGLRVIDAPIIRELSIYSTPSASAVAKPTTSTYNFTVDPSTSDPLTIDDDNWSRSVAGITTNGHKIYVSTALVTGNVTEAAKAITWSEPSIYAQRQDGEDADAVTVTSAYNSETGVTTLSFNNGVSTTTATVTDGSEGTTKGVVPIFASSANDQENQSFTQGTLKYVNYYEYTNSKPTLPVADLTFVKYIGEDGDSEGVLPIYADDAEGANATFTFNNHSYVNFYEWTGTAPTTVPEDLTYVKFVGTDGINADVYKYAYKDSLNKPTSKPTDNAATGWVTSIPATINNTLWQSIGKQAAGAGDFVWSEVTQVTAKDGLSALLFDWTGSEGYNTNTDIDGADEWTFDSAFAGNAFIRINAQDAEGAINVAFNDVVLGTMSGPDNVTKWYEFAANNLVVGTNSLKIWSTTGDGGSTKAIKVAFSGAQGVQGIQGLTGQYTDFWFTRSVETPIVKGEENAPTWYTSVSSVPAGAGNLWSIKEVVTAGGASTSYSSPTVIQADIVRELVLYSGAVTASVTKPTDTEVTYNFNTSSLTNGNTNWSETFPSGLADGKKVYRTTAIVAGNITETAKAVTGWSDPNVYAERKDGENGVSYTGTTEYYKVTSTDTAPDKYSEGTTIDETWSTSVTTPDSTNKYLWNFNRNTKSNSTFTDSAVTLITQYVKDGRGISSITEQYQKSNSGTTAPTGTWSDTIPELTDTDKYLWNQTTINYTDGVNPTIVKTLIAVKGEDGTPADVYKFVYKDSLTKPSKPTDNTATGWVDSIPTTINNTLWQSQGKQTQGAGDYVWQEPVQITAKDGLSALLHEWSGSESWPYGAGNSIDTAYKQTFTSAFAGNAFIRVNALDAEGGLQIALNNTVLGTMSGPDNATKWYEFSSESLVVGTNTLSFWSEAVDGGSIKEIQVAFVGAQGIQGITGDYVDFKFTRKTSVPADPGGDDTWYTSVTSVPDGAGDLYSIKEVITNGGATTTYTDKRVIEAPIVREVVMYSGAVTSAPAVPTTDVSYNFATDSLTDTNTSWSTSFPATLAKDKKVYRITAIAKGNITQTAVSLNNQWSTPVVYAERVDGAPGQDGTTALKVNDLLADYKPFPAGTGAATFWNGPNDGNDRREIDYTPFGGQDIIWKAVNNGTDNDNDGGFDASYVSIDNTKTYRFATFIKQFSNNGSKYVGTHGAGGSHILNMNGTENTNPYFWVGDLPKSNRWYLVTGYIHPAGTGATAPINGGVYDVETGIKVSGTTSFKFHSATTTSHIRLYQYYNTSSAADEVWFWDPRIDLMDSQGPSVEDLLRKGVQGFRGTAVLSHSINDDAIDVSSVGSTAAAITTAIAGYWTLAASSQYAAEIAGDTLILTNNSQTSNGGTHIYEYDGTNWASSTAFTINGNAVVEGTLSAAAVGAGHFVTTQFDTAAALTSAGTTMDSKGIRVYDGDGNIRVKIGNLGA